MARNALLGCRTEPLTRVLLVAVACAVGAACEKAKVTSGPGQAGAASTPAPAPTATYAGRRTTSGDIAVQNLNDRIDTLQSRLKSPGVDLPTRTRLFDLLLTRSQFLGTFDDFSTLHAIAEAAVRDFPERGEAHVLEARALGAVHRFREAQAALDVAARWAVDTAARRASLQVAEGRDLSAALLWAKERATAAPTLEHLTLWANAEAALGQFDAADAHYRAALDSYRDVSPFPVAYVLFQRGVMWAEMANAPERALPFYAEAVARLPRYVAANVHLAELEAARGKRAGAIERLRGLVDRTLDPEPMGYLGELLVGEDPKDAVGQELITRARARYEQLLTQHRAAFLDHAAEFFTGPGKDGARAVQLASENLELRQTPRAHALAIEAALAAHDTSLACRLSAAAEPFASQSRNLRTLLETEAGRCGAR
jgi:tetratricopeptide (TPR) repeat protein